MFVWRNLFLWFLKKSKAQIELILFRKHHLINSCAEVLFVSTIFAVQQMPVFGDGLVENNCAACFLVDTNILPEFAVLCVGTVMNVGVNVWVYRKAHGILYGGGGGCCRSRSSE